MDILSILLTYSTYIYIQVCFAQTAALGGFCAEGWATGEETYGLSEWRSRRKLCSQYNIATERKFRECKRCGAVRCRAVSCRAVSCRAVPCRAVRACVRACVHSETVFWRWCTGYQEEMIIIRCDSQKDFSEHGTTAWLAQNKKCVYRTQRNSFLKLEDV